MDDRGNLYADEKGKEEIGRILERLAKEKMRAVGDEKVRDLKDAPKDGISVQSEKVLETLLTMNRHQRRVFFAERRRGVPEEEAIGTAAEALR
jgi:hypothetical protein